MQLKWTSSPRDRGLENFEVRPSLSTIQIYSSSQNASLCSAPAPDQMSPEQRSWAQFASPQHGQSEPESVGRSGGAGAQGSGCKMPMFMSVLYGRSRIDCGFDAMQDSNLEFRIADSRAWIAKSEFSGSIGKSCITTGLCRQATDLTLSPGVHELVGQIRPPNMFWTPPGPPEDDPARHKSISRL